MSRKVSTSGHLTRRVNDNEHRSSYHVMLNNITNDLDLLLSEFCHLNYPDPGEPPPHGKSVKNSGKKPMQIENCSAFGGSSTSGTLTSTDSNLSNKDVRSATLTSTDSNNSVTRANNISVQSSQIDVFGITSPKATEHSVYPERPPSQSRSTSGSDLRQITVLERLTKTHPIWFLPTVGRSGAVHLVKNKETGIFIVRKSSREEIMALSVQFPCEDGTPNVDHYLIEPTENGLHLQGSTKLFSSIPHLIAHYCDNKEDLPHRLILPPAIRNVKTSQELSALAMLGQDFWISSKYDGQSKSRSSSRSNLSDHSSLMNKSVSEPISINNNNKSLVPAYSQSEGLLQNTPPKHSVIDFSSYLIRKPDQTTTVSQNFTQHESRFTESVQKSCSMMTNGRHPSDHVTSVMHSGSYRSSEVVVTENTMVTIMEDMCNRDSQISADYAQPDKTANKQACNPPVSAPMDLLGISEDYYFRSNLSDKMSDYEDIWKYAESNVVGVQADIVQRLQPNMLSFPNNNNNNVIKGRENSSRKDVISESFFSEKCVVKDVNVSHASVTQESSGVKSTKVLHIDHSSVLPNGIVRHCEVSSNQSKVPECDNQSVTNCAGCSIETKKEELVSHIRKGRNSSLSQPGVTSFSYETDESQVQNFISETFDTILEHECDVDSNRSDHDDDCDADTEDGDVLPHINSVHTQTSPLWKTKSPVIHGSRRSASTSSLSTMRTPVYAEPFDAISPDGISDSSKNERIPKLPKKQRRKSAPAASHIERRLRKNENGRKLSMSELENEGVAQPEFENIEENEEVFVLSVENDSGMTCENTRQSKLEKLYETAWVDERQQPKKTSPNKPKPSPRKTKQNKHKHSVPNLKSSPEFASNHETDMTNTKNAEAKFTINVLEQIKTMQEFEDNNEIPSSPVLSKFPVYDRQVSMETKVSYSEGSTAEDMICSWNPELTLRPIKPFPVLQQLYGAMSEYDNLNSTPYMAPSGQSVASVGTIFCKPWENSVLAKIMKTDNTVTNPSPLSVNSPPPFQAPPPLPPPMDMVERIKAWQESSQVYHSFPNATLDNEYRLSVQSNVNSVEALTSRGEIGSNSDFRVSSNGQNSSEKTLVNEKSPPHSTVTQDKACEDIPVPSMPDIREKVAPVLANPRLLNKSPRSRNPDTKIRDYIISLSKDSSTTFGSTIENFIQCTLESQDSNPFNITRNVRQFMNGIKNYLVKHGEGELEDLIERERIKLGEDEILNIDAIIEGSLHECVLQPLKQNIYRLFVNEYTRNGNLKLLSNNIKYARTKTPEEIGIRKGLSPPDGTTLEVIKHYLSKMQKSFSPLKKLENLLGATSTIYKCVASKQRGKNMCFGADDFLPMLIYVLVHCGTLSVEIEADYMWGLLHPSLLTGEGGYYLTSLSSAVLVLKKFKEMQETKASLHEGQMPSISDMQGFLKIALPNETNDTIDWRTLPVRPSMTTKDVCSMIAHKFKITNPQDFGLYTLENGEECRMMDMECPQMLKADRQSRGKECKFVYKRHAANIAWPKSVK